MKIRPHEIRYCVVNAILLSSTKIVTAKRLKYTIAPCVNDAVYKTLFYLLQVKTYSYSYESRHQAWDKSQKGTVQLSDEYLGFYFDDGLITFGLSEYVLVSLALALIIAVFSPAVHNTIVHRASARLGNKSLYWGTAVVSNVFIYGLVFALGRGLFIIIEYLQLLVIKHFTASLLIVPCIQEVVVHVIREMASGKESLDHHSHSHTHTTCTVEFSCRKLVKKSLYYKLLILHIIVYMQWDY